MPNEFSHNKKLKFIAGSVADEMTYLKDAESFFSQGELAGKKYGQTLKGYMTDPGTTKEGIVASPSPVVQVEVEATMNNENTSVETDLWQNLNEIESFEKEIAGPRARNLALTVQDKVMGENMFRSAQAVVASSASFGLLSKSAAKLRGIGLKGQFQSYQNSDVFAAITESGLAKFLPSEAQTKVYGDAALGRYAGANQIELPNTPIVDTTGMDTAPTISAEVVKDSSNNIIGLKPITTATKSNAGNLIVGVPYKVSGLKIRNDAGLETNNDYIVIWTKENKGGVVSYGIPELRITVKGKGYGNANAWVDASVLAAQGVVTGDTATLTLTPLLTASKQYAVGQCVLKGSVKFNQYKFGNLPGSDTSDVATFGGITVKMMEFGDGTNGVKMSRIDMAYLAKLFEQRNSVTTYTEI